MLTTPQWLQECPFEPIPPIDMKAICIGEVKVKDTIYDAINFVSKEAAILVYVEIDDYFKEDNYV